MHESYVDYTSIQLLYPKSFLSTWWVSDAGVSTGMQQWMRSGLCPREAYGIIGGLAISGSAKRTKQPPLALCTKTSMAHTKTRQRQHLGIAFPFFFLLFSCPAVALQTQWTLTLRIVSPQKATACKAIAQWSKAAAADGARSPGFKSQPCLWPAPCT